MADAGEGDARKTKGQGGSTGKRKRKLEHLSAGEKVARIEALEKELEGLFGYYKELKNQKVGVDVRYYGSRNATVGVLLEESEFPLTRLVDEIHDTLKKVDPDPVTVTHAIVKSCVISVGQRLMYGVTNDDADILEDHSESCLWCWETRDVKLIPESARGLFIFRRTCRSMIHERITAVSEMISSLKKPESEQNYCDGLIEASAELDKAYSEADIRFLMDALMQKNSVDMTQAKAKQEVKSILQQLDRHKREVKKGNKSMDNELQGKTLLVEKDLKLLKGEAIKDEKCDEKDMRKKRIEKKKQPEQTEKDQRRQEKEASKLKEKRSLQKQVLFMENFLKRSKTSHSFQDDQFSTKSVTCDPSITKSKNVYELTNLSMDSTLATSSDITLEDIRKSHVSLWHHLGQSFRSKRKQGWGIRLKPKSEPFTELKLADTTGVAHYDDLAMEKPVDGFGEHNCDIRSYPTNEDSSYLVAKKCCRGKQLLQFHNSNRPAFYGIWSKKSQVVGPRHPIRKDPSLDYASSSDEEWFEEEPGEILSDCEEDKESSVEFSKSDDENDDGFFVRDGYLSEDEGVQVDKVIDVEGAESSRSCKDDTESEEFSDLIQQQKNLNNLTVHALKKDQPLIILDLMHGKELGQNFSGTLKLEQMYLKSLSMRAIPGSLCIELSMDEMLDEDQEARLSPGGGASTSREKEHV